MKNHRFIVELENNHHYIIIDTITGYQYYAPAEADANSIASILNSQYDLLGKQRKIIQEYETILEEKGIVVKTITNLCKDCEHSSFIHLNSDDDVWCNIHDVSVAMNDTCKHFKGA